MKVRILVGLLSMSMLGLWACEDSAEKEAEKAKEQQAQEAAKAAEQKPAEAKPAEPVAEAPKPPEVPPKQICEESVAAAKAKDEGKLVSHGTAEFGSVEGAKESLTAYLGSKPWACGEGKVDGDKGTVPLTAGAGKKAKKGDLPVIKASDGWKIDAATFLKSHPPIKAKAKKGAKGAKKTKA